jgi:hypothetical protein
MLLGSTLEDTAPRRALTLADLHPDEPATLALPTTGGPR